MEMTLGGSKFSWVYAYKIHHLIFWALYHFVWWSYYQGGALEVLHNLSYAPYLIRFLFFVLFQALGVYFCLYYLIPKFLERRKYIIFILLLLATIIVMSLLISFGYLFDPMSYNFGSFKTINLSEVLKTHAIPSSLSSMTLGMAIKLAKNGLESQRQKQILEKEKLETELKFLKSQFNPHFLFNTINSVFVLINQDPKKATDSLAKFSELLRYQLYECNEPLIPLDHELSYIKSYVELENLRQHGNFHLESTYLDESTNYLAIAPFILMPFIENAFKHSSTYNYGNNWIRLEFSLEGEQLIFIISNSSSKMNSSPRILERNSGGLGLQNVQRRLELLYPNAHNLKITQNDEYYSVRLVLDLTTYNFQPLAQFQND